MMNKELLLATEGQTAGHIKLTVGTSGLDAPSWGYLSDGLTSAWGSVSKVPTWNLQGKPIAMMGLYSYSTGGTSLLFTEWSIVDANTITVTVVEKRLTATLVKKTDWLNFYGADTNLFNSSDVGKTFTIVFDPEPSGYK